MMTDKFDIVEYFKLFNYKDRETANKSFRDLIHAILCLPTVGKNLASFAEFHYINDCSVRNQMQKKKKRREYFLIYRMYRY